MCLDLCTIYLYMFSLYIGKEWYKIFSCLQLSHTPNAQTLGDDLKMNRIENVNFSMLPVRFGVRSTHKAFSESST